jgi:hypothetical protein
MLLNIGWKNTSLNTIAMSEVTSTSPSPSAFDHLPASTMAEPDSLWPWLSSASTKPMYPAR